MKSFLFLFFAFFVIVNVTTINVSFVKETKELFKRHKHKLNINQSVEIESPLFEERTKWILQFITSKKDNGVEKFYMPIGFGRGAMFTRTEIIYVRYKLLELFPDSKNSIEATRTFDAYLVVFNKKN